MDTTRHVGKLIIERKSPSLVDEAFVSEGRGPFDDGHNDMLSRSLSLVEGRSPLRERVLHLVIGTTRHVRKLIKERKFPSLVDEACATEGRGEVLHLVIDTTRHVRKLIIERKSSSLVDEAYVSEGRGPTFDDGHNTTCS
ncbi:hypothetical protein EVAR_58218_1 [Eumeta japonica]|uniref:Uncharacterized protein n=1 Tax=Eumeta variegata TaxID=151549 RepID=A0A4C1ZP97_EUMVA|nr:hypothetical protein EVAR_58218_1 [Eumeta japonica]